MTRASANRRFGGRGGGRRGGGGGVTYLADFTADGTFTRASVTFAQTSAVTLVSKSVDERAFEDLGDGKGSLWSCEEQWTQLLATPRDMQGAGWTVSGGATVYTNNAANGPDGSALADRNDVPANGTSYGRFRTETVTTAVPYTASWWARADAADCEQQAIFYRTTTIGQRLYNAAMTSAWRACQLTDSGAGTGLTFQTAEGRTIGGLGAVTLATNCVSDFRNMRSGRYALRPTDAAAATVIAPDNLSVASGWNAQLATSKWTIYLYPKWGTLDLVSGDARWILSFAGGADGMRFRHDGTAVRVEVLVGGVVKAASQYIGTVAKHGAHRVTFDIPASVVTHNSTPGTAGATITLPTSGAIRWGGVHGAAAGSGLEVSARVARPYPGNRNGPPGVAFVGDSITEGFGSTTTGLGGFRRRISDNLASDGLSASIVSLGEVRDANFANSDHSGVGGETVSQITTRIAANYGTGKRVPGMWVAHVGTNNAGTDPLRTAFTTDYPLLLAAMRTAAPGARIIVSTLIDSSDASYRARINSINAELPGLWSTFEATYGVTLIKLDLNATVGAWSAGTYSDFAHPNNSGYALMGDAIDAAMRTALGLPA